MADDDEDTPIIIDYGHRRGIGLVLRQVQQESGLGHSSGPPPRAPPPPSLGGFVSNTTTGDIKYTRPFLSSENENRTGNDITTLDAARRPRSRHESSDEDESVQTKYSDNEDNRYRRFQERIPSSSSSEVSSIRIRTPDRITTTTIRERSRSRETVDYNSYYDDDDDQDRKYDDKRRRDSSSDRSHRSSSRSNHRSRSPEKRYFKRRRTRSRSRTRRRSRSRSRSSSRTRSRSRDKDRYSRSSRVQYERRISTSVRSPSSDRHRRDSLDKVKDIDINERPNNQFRNQKITYKINQNKVNLHQSSGKIPIQTVIPTIVGGHVKTFTSADLTKPTTSKSTSTAVSHGSSSNQVQDPRLRKRRNSESLLDDNYTITPLNQNLPRLPVTPPPLSMSKSKQQPTLVVPPLAKPSQPQQQQRQQQHAHVPSLAIPQSQLQQPQQQQQRQALPLAKPSQSQQHQQQVPPLAKPSQSQPQQRQQLQQEQVPPLAKPTKSQPQHQQQQTQGPTNVQILDPRLNRARCHDTTSNNNNDNILNSSNTTSNSSSSTKDSNNLQQRIIDPRLLKLRPQQLRQVGKNQPNSSISSTPAALVPHNDSPEKEPPPKPSLLNLPMPIKPLPNASSLFGNIGNFSTSSKNVTVTDTRSNNRPEGTLHKTSATPSNINLEKQSDNSGNKTVEPEKVKGQGVIVRRRVLVKPPEVAPILLRTNPLPRPLPTSDPRARKEAEPLLSPNSTSRNDNGIVQTDKLKINEKLNQLIEKQRSNPNTTRKAKLIIENPLVSPEEDKKKKSEEAKKAKSSQNSAEKSKTPSKSSAHEIEKKSKDRRSSSEHEKQSEKNDDKKNDDKCENTPKPSNSKGNNVVEKRKKSMDIEKNDKDLAKRKSSKTEESSHKEKKSEKRRNSTDNENETKSKKHKKHKKSKKSDKSKNSEKTTCLLEIITLSSDSESPDDEIYSNILTGNENVEKLNETESILAEKQSSADESTKSNVEVQSQEPIKIVFPIGKSVNKSRSNSGSNNCDKISSKELQVDTFLEMEILSASTSTLTTPAQLNSTSTEDNLELVQDDSSKEKGLEKVSESTISDKSNSITDTTLDTVTEVPIQENPSLLIESETESNIMEAQKSNSPIENDLNKVIYQPEPVTTKEKTIVDQDQEKNSYQNSESTPVSLSNNTDTISSVDQPSHVTENSNNDQDNQVPDDKDKEIILTSNMCSDSHSETPQLPEDSLLTSADLAVEKEKNRYLNETINSTTTTTSEKTANSDEIVTVDNDKVVIVAPDQDQDQNKEVEELIPQTTLNDENQMTNSESEKESENSNNDKQTEQTSCIQAAIVEESQENIAGISTNTNQLESISMELETQDEEQEDNEDEEITAASTDPENITDKNNENQMNENEGSNEILMTLEEQSSIDNFISDLSNQNENSDSDSDSGSDSEDDLDQIDDQDDEPIDNETFSIFEKNLSVLKKCYDDFDLQVQNNELDEETRKELLIQLNEKIHECYFDVVDSIKELEISDSDENEDNDEDVDDGDGDDLQLSTEEKSIYIILIIFLRRLLNDKKFSVHCFFIRDLIHIFQRILYFTSKSNMSTTLTNIQKIIQGWITSRLDNLKISQFEQEFTLISKDLCEFYDETPIKMIKYDFGVKKYISPIQDIIYPKKLPIIPDDIKILLDDLDVIKEIWERNIILRKITDHENDMDEILTSLIVTTQPTVPDESANLSNNESCENRNVSSNENPSDSTLPVSEGTPNLNNREASSNIGNLNEQSHQMGQKNNQHQPQIQHQQQQQQQQIAMNILAQNVNPNSTISNNTDTIIQNHVPVITQLPRDSNMSTLVVNTVEVPRPSTHTISSANPVNQNLSMSPIQRSNQISQIQTLQNIVSSMPSPSQQQIQQALSTENSEASRFTASTIANQIRTPTEIPLQLQQQTQQHVARMNNLQANINRIIYNNINQNSQVASSSSAGENLNLSRLLNTNTFIAIPSSTINVQNQSQALSPSTQHIVIRNDQHFQQQNQNVIQPRSQSRLEIRVMLTKEQQRTLIRPQLQQQQRQQFPRIQIQNQSQQDQQRFEIRSQTPLQQQQIFQIQNQTLQQQEQQRFQIQNQAPLQQQKTFQIQNQTLQQQQRFQIQNQTFLQQQPRFQNQNQTVQQQQRLQNQTQQQQANQQSLQSLQQVLQTKQQQPSQIMGQQHQAAVSINSQGMNFPQQQQLQQPNVNVRYPFASQRYQTPRASSSPLPTNHSHMNQILNHGSSGITNLENRRIIYVRSFPDEPNQNVNLRPTLVTPTTTMKNPNLANLISNTNSSIHSPQNLQQRPQFNNPRTFITPNLNNILKSNILPLSIPVSSSITSTSISSSISSKDPQSQSIIDLRLDQRDAEPPPQPRDDPLSL